MCVYLEREKKQDGHEGCYWENTWKLTEHWDDPETHVVRQEWGRASQRSRCDRQKSS